MRLPILLVALGLSCAAHAKPAQSPAPVPAEKAPAPEKAKPPDTIDEATALRAQLALAEMRAADARMDAATKDYQIKQFMWEQVKRSLAEKYKIDVERGDDWAPQPGGKWRIVRKAEAK